MFCNYLKNSPASRLCLLEIKKGDEVVVGGVWRSSSNTLLFKAIRNHQTSFPGEYEVRKIDVGIHLLP